MSFYFQLLVAVLLSTHTSCVTQVLTQHTSCDCRGTRNGEDGSIYLCGDKRLGPSVLPTRIPLSDFLHTYDRFGGLTPGEFLAKWTDVNGSYIYPEHNGFQLNTAGAAINGSMTLQNGTLVDRFGSEYGKYVSAAESPYSQRSLPPTNLENDPSYPNYPNNYHLYKVIKQLPVIGGPIGPWFGQPGLGAQFYTGGTGNIIRLISMGYLEKLKSTELYVHPSETAC